MIDITKIKWIKPDIKNISLLSYKGIELDIRYETISDMRFGNISEKDAETIILESYIKSRKLMREKKIKHLLSTK